MKKVLSPMRVTKSILLLALLVAPGWLLVLPTAAQAPVCVAAIASVTVTPSIWVDPGQRVTIRVHVINNASAGSPNPDPDDPLTRWLRVSLRATYFGEGEAPNPPVDTVSNDIPVPGNFSVAFTVRSDAPTGLGHIAVQLLGPATGTHLPCTTVPNQAPFPPCSMAQAENCNWGFVVGDKPDPVVTSFSLRRHSVSDLPGAEFEAHGQNFSESDRFTRYLDHQETGPPPIQCFENDETRGGGFFSNAHLLLTVRNNGTADYNMPDGSRSLGLPLRVRVLDSGVSVGTNFLSLSTRAGDTGTFLLDSVVYNIRNKTNIRNITVIVDPVGEVPETDETNNEFANSQDPADPSYVNIRAPDLVTILRDVQYDANDRRIEGDWTILNNGTSRAGRAPAAGQPRSNICHSANGRGFNATIYLDRISPDTAVPNAQVTDLTLDTPGNGTSQATGPRFAIDVGAGTRRIFAVADSGGTIHDLNESNDVAEFVVAINDTETPTINPPVNITAPNGFRVGQRINISGAVTDDADFRGEENVIQIEAVYPDGSNNTLVIPRGDPNGNVVRAAGTTDRYIFWLNSAYLLAGTYQVRVRAIDSANHSAAFPLDTAEPLTFTLTDYPRNMELYSMRICRELAANVLIDCLPFNGPAEVRNANHTFAPNLTLEVVYRVPVNSTGLANESRNFTRKTIQLTDPDNNGMGNFTVEPACWNNLTESVVECPAPPQPPAEEDCADAPVGICYNYLFWPFNFQSPGDLPNDPHRFGGSPVGRRVLFTDPFTCTNLALNASAQFLQPGRYNFTYWVGDAGCNFSGHGHPIPPLFQVNLWDNITATITNITPPSPVTVNAGFAVNFRAHIGDNWGVKQGFVLVKRAGAIVAQVNMTPERIEDRATQTGNYSVSMATGLGAPVCNAGAYKWQVGARDHSNSSATDPPERRNLPHGLNYSQEFDLTVRDTRLPTIANPQSGFEDGTPSDAFQVGSNVTFQAELDDDTCFTAQAVVRNVNNLVVLTRNLTAVGSGNLFRTAVITTGPVGDLVEGEYTFVIQVTDSAGNIQPSAPRSFRVAGNLPPSFTGRLPDDGGFGRPDAPAQVIVSDPLQGVLRSSIQVKAGVNGPANTSLPASSVHVTDRDVRAGDGVALSLLVSIDLPALAQHGDNVTLNVSATDGTDLTGSSQWTFRLDGLAPRSTLTCDPSAPPHCAGTVPGVRGDTLFTISAVDVDPDDKVRSGVASIRYVVTVAGQSSAPQVVGSENATFSLSQFTTQDGVVQIRYRAVDRAGNEEPERPFSVHLDTQGPLVENVVTTPTATGWTVTATVTDIASDVATVTMRFRTGLSSFDEVRMTRLQETQFWSGQLPAVRRGASVCYFLEAEDTLGNKAFNGTEAAPVCFTAENHPPQLRVLSPADGEQVATSMTVRWEVSDIDGDRPTVSIAYRRASESQLISVPLSADEARGSGSKIVDTSALAADSYVLRVDAIDGQDFNNRTSVAVNFTKGGPGGDVGIVRLEPSSVAPGTPFKVRVTLPRAANDVVAVLLKDGREVQRQPMDQNPPGSNTWEATFRVSEPGTYTVEVRGTYADGTPFIIPAGTPLTVQGGLPVVLDVLLILILAGAVIALAVVGLRRGT